MELLLIKLMLTPLLVAIATIAARRWGHGVSGWIAGLPLTPGPISVYLALEQGRVFAAQAAHGTLLGIIAVEAFCVGYARSARGVAWGPLAVALTAYCLVALGLSFLSIDFVLTVLLATVFAAESPA